MQYICRLGHIVFLPTFVSMVTSAVAVLSHTDAAVLIFRSEPSCDAGGARSADAPSSAEIC